jgi:hypothetical protein
MVTSRKRIRLNVKDFWHPDTPKDISANPFILLLSRRYELRLSTDPDFLIYSVHGQKFREYDCTRIFFTGENVRPNFAECDYAFSFDYSDDERNFRLPNYHLFYGLMDELLEPRDAERIVFEKSRFCNFIVSHAGCLERESFYRLLSRYKRVDSPGQVFKNMAGPSRGGRWFGSKVRFMKPYKFSIVFENSSYPGYTTEKLLSAMAANSVGIYWGNPLVSRDFNPGSFINCHDYPNFEAVAERVRELDKDDATYRRVLSEPFLPDNKLNPELSIDSVLDRFEYIFSKAGQS